MSEYLGRTRLGGGAFLAPRDRLTTMHGQLFTPTFIANQNLLLPVRKHLQVPRLRLSKRFAERMEKFSIPKSDAL